MFNTFKARKAAVDFENDLEPHEKEIGYLEEKGIKLLKNGDVEGSINAFNVAVKLFPQNPSLYMHRAAANLKFGNAIRGAQDAARALEMFIPPVPQNEPQRLQDLSNKRYPGYHILRDQIELSVLNSE